jgi:enoyl-CoA hydratase/carnithine racemase
VVTVAGVLVEETVDRVRVLTLNRPEARNALSPDLIVALYDALVAADADPGVHVVVLTGADPAFCAGVDLKAAAADPAAYFRIFDDKDCINQVARVRKPVIGAVNGATFTGGLEMALGCDFLVASERAFFADTHGRVGVFPGGGMTARLAQAVGTRRAREMSMTGNIVDAATAERIRLVNDVVPHAELLERALRTARAVAETDPDMIQELKRVYAEGSEATVGQALVLERQAARAWSGRHRFEGLADRRDAVIARNRGQLGS